MIIFTHIKAAHSRWKIIVVLISVSCESQLDIFKIKKASAQEFTEYFKCKKSECYIWFGSSANLQKDQSNDSANS